MLNVSFTVRREPKKFDPAVLTTDTTAPPFINHGCLLTSLAVLRQVSQSKLIGA